MSDPAPLFITLYTDEDITSELAPALRERGFEAQSAAEAGLLGADDARQLAYAVEHGLTLLTCNASHFLRLARQYAADGQHMRVSSFRLSSTAAAALANCCD